MPRSHRRSARTTRRTFLGSFGVAVAGLGVASPSGAADDDQFVLEQGDRCVPLTPASGEVAVEDRYRWGLGDRDFSATGLVDVQRPETSILLLYDGPNGLSLVVVHDEYEDGTDGGSATFEFAGLPVDGEWVVRDDYYDGDSNYDRWVRDGETATVDWTWGDGRTDGGVFRGLDDQSDLELLITPAFNDAAALAGEHYDGEITDWQVLSGSLDNPTRTSLDLDEPVLIRRGTCSTDDTDDDEDEHDEEESGDDHDDEKDDEDDEDDEDDDGDEDDEDDDGDDEEDYDDDDDDDDDEDREDDHPGKGKGRNNGKGKGKEKNNGKGQDRGKGKGRDDDDDDDDDHPGKGKNGRK